MGGGATLELGVEGALVREPGERVDECRPL
jgi:hypothetical protein